MRFTMTRKYSEMTRSELLKHCQQLRGELRRLRAAVKKDCYDCVGGQRRTDCGLEKCPLFPYRPWAGKKDLTRT